MYFTDFFIELIYYGANHYFEGSAMSFSLRVITVGSVFGGSDVLFWLVVLFLFLC